MNFKSENETSNREVVLTVLAILAYFLIGGYTINLFPTSINPLYIIVATLIISPLLYYVLKKASS